MALFKFTDGETREFEVDIHGVIVTPEGDADVVCVGGVVSLILSTGEYTLKQSNVTEKVSVSLGGLQVSGVRVGLHMLVNITSRDLLFLLPDGTYFVLPYSYVANLEEECFTGKLGGIPMSLIPTALPTFLSTKRENVHLVCERDLALFAISQGRRDFVTPNQEIKSPTGPICNLDGDVILHRGLKWHL